MSFGSAAARRGRRPPPAVPCPCGSGHTFSACCGPVLEGASAPSPEALMRSRFTAFALGDLAHLQSSWHPTARPQSLALDDASEWRRLDVIRTHQEGTRGTVEFRAHWRDPASGATGELHEVSRFRQVSGRWFYVDGEIE